MASLTIPHVFEGNTPAIATDVNDNFSAVEEFAASINNDVSSLASDVGALDEYAHESVNNLTESSANKYLNNLTDNGYGKLMMNTFCANSGNQEANGYADLVSYTGGVVSFKVDDGATYKPLTCTFTDGETKTLTSLDSIDMSALANGTYTFFVNKTGETLAKLVGNIFLQDSQPATTNGNVWLDTSKTPYKSYVANGSNFDTAFDYVQLPVEVVLESGAVSSVANGRYNGRTREILAGWGMPDDSRALSVSITNPYTVPFTGEINMYLRANSGSGTVVYRNGVEVGRTIPTSTTVGSILYFPVSAGDIITFEGPGLADGIIRPYKGV